ncbi:MAG: glycosyltransferase [Flavobacteriales bacterium]|nr:glycosyltransferase [Flavobacteriales bacterium]MBX2960268.1 glycosyltransferase [Flavobacteriales bacterium]MCL4856003.1 glycosyltransferase [Flavobacteriales bacterium]
MSKGKIIVSVTNDLVTDQRVNRVCSSLLALNFEVLLVGRKLNNSLPINRKYQTKRFSLLFNKGFLFYANYNIRLFFFLLFSKSTILWSNDLDTLPANYLVSKLKGVKLVYDSHEYFTEVPELVNRPRVQKVWQQIEKWIFPKLKNVITVSNEIANAYHNKYHVKSTVIRNLPFKNKTFYKVKDIKKEGYHLVIYQGSVNVNRGIKPLVKAMKFVDKTKLYIIGDGDIFDEIVSIVRTLNLEDKVTLLGKIPFELLPHYTFQADLGVSLEENVGLNYKYALPNKLFDYINAGLPVLTSNLPEMEAVVKKYEIGETISLVNPKTIAEKINELFSNKEKLNIYAQNSLKAKEELCWENEEQKLQDFVNEIK